MTIPNCNTPTTNAAFKRSMLALAIAMSAGASHAQTLGAQVGGTLNSVGSAVGTKIDAAGTAMSDTAVTAKLKGRISSDANLEGSKISVKTTHGIAILTGSVPTAAASEAAAKLAASTEGVSSVDNRLMVADSTMQANTNAATTANANANLGINANANADVNADPSLGAEVKSAAKATSKAITDSWITTKVKTDLLADAATEGRKIKVSTKRGVVYLSGTVKSAEEKAAAVEQAAQIEGVKRVSATKLRVRADASVN